VVTFKWMAATVPGKRITHLPVSEYKDLRGKNGQEAAAAKTGISVASARRLDTAVVLPSQRPPRHWRTRVDTLAEVWDAEVVPMLEGAPSLMTVTVLEELQRRHPERFADAVLRTLQRRVSQWRAEHGDEREIYFAQEHPQGRLGLSDFTVADELTLSLAAKGDEGARGLKEMHERGVLTVAPGEASCVVFGIPKEGIRMGGVDPVLPLSEGARSTLAFDRRG
jgi:hypothetical protein